MAKKTKLTPYDPDKYRDELNRAAWEKSGAKTTKELFSWLSEQQRKLREAAAASGLSMIEYIIAEKKAQAQAKAQAHG
jgi:hypothetical protein